MIEVFKVALAQWLLFFGYDLFYNGRNSPESLQAYDPALGGYIIQIEITCKSHVAASMHHDTWGLMQSHFYWPYGRLTHHIIMSWPLGATNCSCQNIKVHKH